MKEICVIGGGAAGLCAIRHINSSPGLHGVVFEQMNHIGGIWAYTKHVGEGVHSSAYKSLRTNLPKEIMGFSWDFPFPSEPPKLSKHPKGQPVTQETPSFVSHRAVKKYLQFYADHYKLCPHIQFNTKVTNVKPIFDTSSPDPKWRVAVLRLEDGREEINEFDSVIVCNGHYSQPIVPQISNLDQFGGLVMHSVDYRTPEIFAGKRVIIVGCGSSGMDISLEVAHVATQVILSLKNPPLPYNPELPTNLKQMPPISQATDNGAVFQNGVAYSCDIILFCTGYQYDFPFLDATCQVDLKHGRRVVSPLYRHLVHTKYPSLCFIGLPFLTLAFYLIDRQMKYYLTFLEGQLKLPSEIAMNEWRSQDQQKRRALGIPDEKDHQLGELQWDYYKDLATEAEFPDDLREVVKKIGYASYERRVTCPMEYKEDVFCIVNDKSYIHIKACVDPID